jgi:hypothetical protein
MPRFHVLIATLVLLGLVTSCKQSSTPVPVVVHVLRDPSFAGDLFRFEVQFGLTSPRLLSGRAVKLETTDDIPFMDIPKRLKAFSPHVLILNSLANIPNDPAVGEQLGRSELVCGMHPAFIPTPVSGEEREAAETYLRFLVSRCPANPVQTATSVGTHTATQSDEQPEKDPNRPPCTSPWCQKVRQFLKDHYCGESPFGNGPDGGCDIRGSKKLEAGTTLTADYVCKWNDANATSKCQQHGQPSPAARDIMLREMRRVGLPARAEEEVHFTVLESTSGWSLMAANYDHIRGADLTLCQVVVVLDQSGRVQVLRKVRLRKTNADAPDVTTWSPVDVADVDSDGSLEVILEGDAYEDHWFEVVRVQDGSFKTIFSGLGYYL